MHRRLSEVQLRIVHVVNGFPPDGFGGIQRHVSDLASESGNRHVVTVIAFTDRALSDAAHLEQRGNIQVRWISKPDSGSAGRDDRWPALEQAFESAIRDAQPDIVHIHHLAGLSTELVALAKKIARVVVVTLHDYLCMCPTDTIDCRGKLCFTSGARCYSCLFPDVFARRRDVGLWRLTNPLLILYGRTIGRSGRIGQILASLAARQERHFDALRQANELVSPSVALAHTFAEAGIGRDISIVTHGVTIPSEPINRSVATGKLRFGFIGSHRVKGLEMLLKAFAMADFGDAELHVYTNMPSYSRPVGRRLRKLADHPRVHLNGMFAPEHSDSVFAAFDVLVAPSIWIEPFGLVASEAVARGVPVIAADSCGLEETVVDGVNGILFRRGNTNELGSAMARCVSEPSLVEHLQRGCHRIKYMAEQDAEIESLYIACIQHRNRLSEEPQCRA